MKNNATLIITGIPIVAMVFVGAVLASNFVSADDVVDEINITVPVSCTMSGTGMNSHNANITNGTYQADIGTTTLHAFCNDNNGFAIYAAGYTGNEIGATNSNKLVGTSASSNATIETGLATAPGNPDISNWAMKLAMTQDSGDTTGTNAYTIDSAPNMSGGADVSFSQYHVVPNEYTKVAHKNSATDMTANTGGVKLTTTYAAYISKTQPADTYTGQVIYTLVHPASHAAPVSFDMAFANANKTKLNGYYKMQDMTSAICSSVNLVDDESQTTLIDSRDNKTYTVSKLRDGNCWMTQNLDLDLDSETTYTNLDTDLGWNGTSYSTASWTPENSVFVDVDDWHEHEYEPKSYDPGDLYWNGVFVPEDEDSCEAVDGVWDGWRCVDLDLADYVSSIGDSHYHLGNYYDWLAAIAEDDGSSYSYYDIANQSICPRGWTLPIGGYLYDTDVPDKSFLNMILQYGWSEETGLLSGNVLSYEAPLHLVLSGSMNYSDEIGLQGHYWTSTSLGWDVWDGSAFQFVSSSINGYITPDGDDITDFGFSVRCISR